MCSSMVFSSQSRCGSKLLWFLAVYIILSCRLLSLQSQISLPCSLVKCHTGLRILIGCDGCLISQRMRPIWGARYPIAIDYTHCSHFLHLMGRLGSPSISYLVRRSLTGAHVWLRWESVCCALVLRRGLCSLSSLDVLRHVSHQAGGVICIPQWCSSL